MMHFALAAPSPAEAGKLVFDGLVWGLTTLLEFAALISVVVFFHELGHLLVAKAFNVKALRFSIGFGRKLFAFRLGETEYCVSMLPFGGYVKFAGENPEEQPAPEDKGRGFLEASALARGVIAFAGPFANFVLALVIGFCVHLLPVHDSPAVAGFIKPGSPAERAGLRHGDRLLGIDGQMVRGFLDLKEKVDDAWGRTLKLRVQRGGESFDAEAVPDTVESETPLGIERHGRLGISASGRQPSIAVLGPQTPAGRAGLQTFDQVTKVAGAEVQSYEDLLDLLAAKLSQQGEPQTLAIEAERRPAPPPLPPQEADGQPLSPLPPLEPPAKKEAVAASLVVPALGRPVKPEEVPALLGLASSDLAIALVRPNSAAALAGLQRGDRVLEVQGKPVVWWADEVEHTRQQVGTAPLHLVVLRDGARLELTVTQTQHPGRDENGLRRPIAELGAWPQPVYLRPADQLITYWYGPAEALRRGAETALDATRKTALGIARMVTGHISADNISGPLMIAETTRKMADVSWPAFFVLMLWISANLGVMNLLPIPLLDGFHVLSALIEGVRRRPLPLRFREVANTVGFMMVAGLMLLAISNDLIRIGGDVVQSALRNWR
jgi:regulator of sigma E protease